MYFVAQRKLLSKLMAAALIASQSIAFSPANAQQQNVHPAEEKSKDSRSFSFLHGDVGPRATTYDDSQRVILVEATVAETKVWAVIDTGSEGTVVDSALARNLGLSLTPIQGRALSPNGDRLPLEHVDQVSIELKDQFVITGPSLALDLTAISKRLNRKIGLLVGMDVIGSLAMVVNGPKKEIMFVAPGTVRPNSDKLVELQLTDGLISGSVAGKTAQVGVDLGSASPATIRRTFCDSVFNGCPSVPVGTSADIAGSDSAIEGVRQVEFSLPGASGPIDMVVQEFTGTADIQIGYPFFRENFTVFDYANERMIVIFR